MLTTNQDSSKYKYLSPWNPFEENSYKPRIQVVSCVIQKETQLLALQRAREDVQHNLWGIPGGKLDPGELPIQGLARELEEELSIAFDPSSFTLLGTALSHTSADGEYGLYVYHTSFPKGARIQINLEEHHAFLWATLEEFQALDLLFAQGEAFRFVYDKIRMRFN